jgi:hypothetical protein
MKNKETKNEVINDILTFVSDNIGEMGLEDMDRDTIKTILEGVSEANDIPKFNDTIIDLVYSGIERELNEEDIDEIWKEIGDKLEELI